MIATETHHPHAHTHPVTQGSRTLTVYVHNILTSNPTGAAGLAQQAQQLDADIVALIEVTRPTCQTELDALARTYPYSYGQATDAPEGTAIYSRYPLHDTEPIEEGNSRLGFTTTVTIDDQPLRVFITHPMAPVKPSWTRRWLRDLTTLATRINTYSEEHILIMGDFNADPAHTPYRALLNTAGVQDISPGLTTWPAHVLVPAFYAIDHILVKGPIEHTTVTRTPALGSDHYGLVARLRMNLQH